MVRWLRLLLALLVPAAIAWASAAGEPSDEIRTALAEARSRLEKLEAAGEAPADAPQGAPLVEVNERLMLARQLASLYQQQLDSIDRATAARQRLDDTQRARDAWRGFDDAPPRSLLVLDALRDEVDATAGTLDQARARISFLERADANYAPKLKAAQGAARLAGEAADQARGTPDLPAMEWRRNLAIQRAAVDGATQVLIQLNLHAARAEAEAATAAQELARRKLADAGTTFVLARADLDKVLADLDARRRVAERELDRATRAASRTSDAAASAPANMPERELAVRREEATTASQRVFLLRQHLLQIEGERATWEARGAAIDSRDPVQGRSMHEKLTSSLAGIRTTKQYLEQQLAAVSGRIRDEELRRRGPAQADDAIAQRLIDTLRAREADLRRAIDNGSRLERLVSRFRADFESRRETSLADRATDAAAGAWLAVRQAWNYELFTIEDALETAEGKKITVARSVTVGKSFGAVLIVLVGYWLCSLVVRRLERRAVARGRATEQSAALVRKWVLFVLAAVLSILALVTASIPLTAFAFLGGALAIAAGFGLQNLLKNLVSGVMLLVERPIRLGDLVEVDNVRGRITEIGIRASTIRTVDGIESIIPNSRMVEGTVTNWTYTSARTRQSIKVGVAYGSPLRQVQSILEDVLAKHGLVLKDPPPQVYLDDYAESSIDFGLTYWVEMVVGSDARRVKSDLLHMIGGAFGDAGIAIPFPQRDVRIDTARPVPVEIVGRAAEAAPG